MALSCRFDEDELHGCKVMVHDVLNSSHIHDLLISNAKNDTELEVRYITYE